MKTTNLESLKRLRRYLLTKNQIWDIYFNSARIQRDLEEVDAIFNKEIQKQLTEISRSRLIENKYSEKV